MPHLDSYLRIIHQIYKSVLNYRLNCQLCLYNVLLLLETDCPSRRYRVYLNSNEFYQEVSQSDPDFKRFLDGHLGYHKDSYTDDDRTRNIEGAAYFADKDGERVLMSPVADYYRNVFLPQEKEYNSDPMFPTEQYWEQVRGLAHGRNAPGSNGNVGIPTNIKGRIPIRRKAPPKSPKKRGK